MAFWNRKKTDSQPGTGEGLDLSRLPRHVGIIMDGNGRWAKKRGLPRTAGHAAGAESFRTIAYYCKDPGIPYLTVYAFSTENWKRPMEEVSAIMDLLQNYLLEAPQAAGPLPADPGRGRRPGQHPLSGQRLLKLRRPG